MEFPIPVDESLEKFSHHLRIGQRVIVRHLTSGHVHHGQVSNLHSNTVHVLVDGAGPADDRLIQCAPSEVSPESFPAPERPAPKGSAVPDAASEKLASFLAGEGRGLMAAADSGKLRDAERGALAVNIELVRKGQDAGDPCGLTESPAWRYLRLMAARFPDTLHKRAAGFSVGDRVREKASGRLGKVTAVQSGAVDVEYDNGGAARVLSSLIEPADALAKRSSAFHPGQAVKVADGRTGEVTRW